MAVLSACWEMFIHELYGVENAALASVVQKITLGAFSNCSLRSLSLETFFSEVSGTYSSQRKGRP